MVREYIFLALGCAFVGVVITFVVLGISQRLSIDIFENFWILAIPVVLSLILNITLLELYRKYKKRK